MPKQTTYLGRAFREKVTELVNCAYASGVKSAIVKIQVPEGFIRENVREKIIAPPTPTTSMLKKIGAGIIPAVGATIGGLFRSGILTAVLAGVGGVLSTLILTRKNENAEVAVSAAPAPQKLCREDIKFSTVADAEAEAKFTAKISGEIDNLAQQISDFERAANSRPDIGLNQSFGEWAQHFIMYADANPGDRKLQRLRDDFVTQLLTMKITVYDELILKADGTPDTPLEGYVLYDPTIKIFTKVERPAIYSERQLLARGKIS